MKKINGEADPKATDDNFVRTGDVQQQLMTTLSS